VWPNGGLCLSNKAFKNYGPDEQQASKQLAWRPHKSIPQIRKQALLDEKKRILCLLYLQTKVQKRFNNNFSIYLRANMNISFSKGMELLILI